ncbi:ABC transporter permease [Sporosarcina sp. FSL K6-1522]|uniref:ABC transporter permease n=1 Tax=Sporosarcina sp. FSL K6-1522 TaxID=2921554 RepID=UPI00315AD523
MMMTFAKRNIFLYFRDKTSVFFSLLAVMILVALYVLFLGDTTAKQLPNFPAKKALLMSWFMAGMLAVTSMTTTLASFGVFVDDRANKTYMDFYSSPISRTKLVGGYITSAVVVGFIMCMFTLIASNIFLFLSGETMLSFRDMLAVSGVTILAVLASAAMVLFLVSFFETSNAFATASTVIGTLLGFLAGIYIPIGNLPDYLQDIVKLFPVSHSAALFRQIIMETPLIDSFANAPAEVKNAFLYNMGVFYDINGNKTSTLFSVFYLCLTTLLFFVLSLFVMKRKNK